MAVSWTVQKGPGIDTLYMGIDTPNPEISVSSLVSIPDCMVSILHANGQHSVQILTDFGSIEGQTIKDPT